MLLTPKQQEHPERKWKAIRDRMYLKGEFREEDNEGANSYQRYHINQMKLSVRSAQGLEEEE